MRKFDFFWGLWAGVALVVVLFFIWPLASVDTSSGAEADWETVTTTSVD